MNRNSRPLIVLLICGGLLLLITATVGPLAGGRGWPTELLPPDDAPPSQAGHHVKPVCPAGDPALLWVNPQVVEVHCNGADIEGPTPEPSAGAEELGSLDLSGLTSARLQRLDGQRLRLRVITDSGVWRVGDRDVFDAVMKDGGDDLAAVWMYANPDIEDGMTVEGCVRVVHQPTIRVGAAAGQQ